VHLKVIAVEPDIEFDLVDARPEVHPLLILPEGSGIGPNLGVDMRAA
jgi:hypothetical protein